MLFRDNGDMNAFNMSWKLIIYQCILMGSLIGQEKRIRRGIGFKKIMLITAGTLFTGIGVVGIFVPILPTTPFLILAAACYIRSSKRLYDWLLSNRLFGKYLRNYLEKRGIPLSVKIVTITLLWATILLSAIVFVDVLFIRILLIIIAVGVTVHLLHIRTYREGNLE